ncbi:MAG: DUF3443 family protein [Rhodoferax sp.]
MRFVAVVLSSLMLAACGGGGGASSAPIAPVVPGNVAPVANAGAAQNVVAGTVVRLDGSASSDPNNDALTYAWTLISRPVGSSAALVSPTSARPTFTADLAGIYLASLTVNDGRVDSSAATVTLTVTAALTNAAPVANAGSAQNALVGALVTLDGSASSDANGDPLTYAWTLTTRPAGSTASLSSASAVKPTFIADLAGTYVASLTVSDGKATSLAATVSMTAADNLLGIVVDAGPAAAGYNVNRLYTSVKICQPGSSQCRTIDHVLLDTGSTGLRLLSSAIKPSLDLERLTGSTGLPLFNCAQFVDNSFAWGPVVSADVALAGKTAASVPIQIMADPAFNNVPLDCSIGGTAMTTPANLGANGILGIGLFREDCGIGCEATVHNGFYYTCTSASCTNTLGTRARLAQQLKNPVSLFATDNNGVLIDLPAVGSPTAARLAGSLVFGIATQSNNRPSGGVVLTTDANGHITTVLGGRTMSNSFLDTGSNGLFFDSDSIPACTDGSAGFYCPASAVNLSATLTGENRVSTSVAFSIGNATAMFVDRSKVVLPGLGGPFGDVSGFDWGLPFFYGRRVFIGIEGRSSPLGTGPYYAF